MFFTISSLCQFGAAGMTARFHWFSRHTNYPFPLCTQRGKGWKATLRQKKRPKANAFSPVSFFRILRITQKKCNVSLLLVYFQSTKLILFSILIWRRGMIPSLQSPVHGYRLRHLSTRVALQPCAYSTGDFPIISLLANKYRFLSISYKNLVPFLSHFPVHPHL